MAQNRPKHRRRWPRRLTVALLAVSAAFVIYWFTRPAAPRARGVHRLARTQVENRELVEAFSLDVGGVPFGREPHRGRAGEIVKLSGSLRMKRHLLPKGAYDLWVWIVCHPAGADEAVWQQSKSPNTTMAAPGWDIAGERLPDRESFSCQVMYEGSPHPPPGEYELRAYLVISDAEGEEDRFDFLGKAQLIVSP